jgi:hypothetical protein
VKLYKKNCFLSHLRTLSGLLLAGFFASSQQAEAAGKVRELALPSLKHAQPYIVEDIGALYRNEKELLIFPAKAGNFLTVPYDESATGVTQAFEAPAEQLSWDKTRILLPQTVNEGHFKGAVSFGNRHLFLLDGIGTRIIVLDKEKKSFLFERSIIMDRVLPPRDSRGEPTAKESAAYRKRFIGEFRALEDYNKDRYSSKQSDIDRLKETRATTMLTLKALPRYFISGIAPLAPGWQKKSGANYLISSQIKGFELMELRCHKEQPGLCETVRGCFLENRGELTAQGIMGIAVSEQRNLLLIGDKVHHEIAVFRYHSCFHVERIGTILLPYYLYELSNIFIDGKDNLWIATRFPDSYHNASLYVWDKKDWWQ